jgi:hypothetical protein
VFYKFRMRRLLRGMIEAAAPPGLRPDRAAIAERALMLERAAIAFGLTWHGLSAAQGALVVIHAARAVAGLGSAEAHRFGVVAQAIAERRGLVAFSEAIDRDIVGIEHVAALRRHGHRPRGLAMLA